MAELLGLSLVLCVGHKDHFRINNNENYYKSFSGCCNGGDILNYMQEVEHLDFKEAKEKLYKITNTPLEDYKIDFKKVDPQPKEDTKELEKINTFVTTEYNKMQNKNELIQYLNNRNISQEAIEKYHLFISTDEQGTQRVYIPILEQGKAVAFIGRATDKEAQIRYKNSKGAIKPFNLDYVKQKAKDNESIFVCEGVFDAISIEEQGFKAISLNSTQNKTKLIEAIKQNIETAKDYTYIIATDNDEPGQKVKDELQKDFMDLNIKSNYVEIPEAYKDINEWYSNTAKENFKNELQQNICNKYTKKTIDYYLGDFLEEIKNYNRYPIKKTGFNFLDRQLDGGIRQGLYVIGAIPSLRKNYIYFTSSRQHSKTRK